MKKILVFLLFIMCVGTFAQRVPDINNNRVDMDLVPIDIKSDWITVDKSDISVSKDEYFKGYMKWTVNMDGPKCKASGIVKEIKDLPMPERIQIKIFPIDGNLSFIGFSDANGNVGLYYPKNIQKMQWNIIDIRPNDILSFALNAPKIEDISKIAFIRDTTGGQGKTVFYIDSVDFIYPFGTYYAHSSIDEILSKIDNLKSKNEELKKRLALLNDEGFPCRYQLSKITVIDEFLVTAKDQAEKKNWLRRADQILDYLEELCDRCSTEFDEIEKSPEKRIDYTESDLNKMVIKDGEILAPVLGGDENELRPVFLTGIMGWFHDDHYKIIRNYGYNCSAFEWEMINTDNEGSTVYFTNKCKALSNTNMAFQVLFSPHYISGEQYNQFPSIDPLGLRRGQIISPYNITSPDLRNIIAHHVENIVPILKDFPNLIGYDLENELYSFPYPDFEYSKFLNDDISYENPWEGQVAYNQHNMYEFVKWFKDEIEKIDNSKVIFTKCCPGLEIPGYEREKISDILSAHSFWSYSDPYPTDDFAANFFLEGMELDTYNSFDKSKIITEGELHLNVVKPQGDIISEKFTNWSLWNMYVRGKDASHIWGWGIDVEDYSNMFHIQPWAVYAAGKANMDVNRIAEYVAPFAKTPGDYAVFYGGRSVEELYKAATFSDAKFDFITDMTVKKGLDKYKFVIILDDAVPAKETLNALKKASIPVVTLSSDGDMRKFWTQIDSCMKKYNVTPLIHPRKFGLDCRSYSKNGKTVFYLSNYSKEKIKVNLPRKSTDLLTGKEYLNITLEPLDFYIMIN